MRIEVTKEVDKHTRQTWVFNLFDLNLVFVEYFLEEKPPRKRKWRITSKWDRYRRDRFNDMKEPELQNHIKREVLDKVKGLVKVITWNEWKNNK